MIPSNGVGSLFLLNNEEDFENNQHNYFKYIKERLSLVFVTISIASSSKTKEYVIKKNKLHYKFAKYI